MAILLGIDLGTSGVKVLAINEKGEALILQQKNGHRVKIHATILNSLNSIGV